MELRHKLRHYQLMFPHTCQSDEKLVDFLKEPGTMPDVEEDKESLDLT
ncbi:MAG: hypothetical protein NTY51_05730 [Deltaproteobacteria bacterium]|nr:hypothetical protein [Deltaproteobacteria bacterium]